MNECDGCDGWMDFHDTPLLLINPLQRLNSFLLFSIYIWAPFTTFVCSFISNHVTEISSAQIPSFPSLPFLSPTCSICSFSLFLSLPASTSRPPYLFIPSAPPPCSPPPFYSIILYLLSAVMAIVEQLVSALTVKIVSWRVLLVQFEVWQLVVSAF